MDERFQNMLHAWRADQTDAQLRARINREARRFGGITIEDAERLQLLAQTVLEHEPDSYAMQLAHQLIDAGPGYQIEVIPGEPPAVEQLADATAVLFRRPESPHVYPDYYPDYPGSGLYRAVMRFGRCMANIPGRRRRGCGQTSLGCICRTSCPVCERCRGCRLSHPSECVCDEFDQVCVGRDCMGGVGFLVHPMPHLCGCHGSGWQGTDADTVHECPIHPIASHHPECPNYAGDISECCSPTAPLPPVDECPCGCQDGLHGSNEDEDVVIVDAPEIPDIPMFDDDDDDDDFDDEVPF